LASIDKYFKARTGVDTPDLLTSSATVYDYLTTPLVQFDTNYSSTDIDLGKVYWNSPEGTLNLGISNTKNIYIGEDAVYRVRNSTGSTILKGTALYASGIEPSGRIDVSPYVADGSIREVQFMGLAAENINNGINGFVQHFGYVTGLDTRGTASAAVSVGDEDWAAGDILYVHPTVPGKLTNIKPQHEITVAIIIKRHQSEGVLFVRPSSAGHLEDNHDINFTGLADNDVMLYDGSASYWYNSNFSTAILSTGSAVFGNANVYMQDEAPSNPDNGDIWVDTDSDISLIWAKVIFDDEEPESPENGLLWIDSDSNVDTLDLTNYALKDSPAFTGIPTAPTASVGTNSTQIATTAFVYSMLSGIDGGTPSSTYEFTIDGGGA